MTDTTTKTISGTFHAGNVFGVGILMGVFPSHTRVRTHKEELMKRRTIWWAVSVFRLR